MTDIESEITADLIAELLREQHPDLADLPVTFAAHGWDNQLWRLGDELAVRLPWATETADALLLMEYAWLGHAGVHGRPGGKATWGLPADAALRRLTATRPRIGCLASILEPEVLTGGGELSRNSWPMLDGSHDYRAVSPIRRR